MTKNNRFVFLSLTVAALVVAFLYYNSATNFCLREMKVLSEREAIDRYLFGANYASLTLEDKKKIIQERNGGVYPECCRMAITGEPAWSHKSPAFSYPHYEIITYFPNKKISGDPDPYYEKNLSLNNCGLAGHRSFGIGISKKTYDENIELNHKYQKE